MLLIFAVHCIMALCFDVCAAENPDICKCYTNNICNHNLEEVPEVWLSPAPVGNSGNNQIFPYLVLTKDSKKDTDHKNSFFDVSEK